MMFRLRLILVASLVLAGPVLAQQNQTPGDTNAGGDSRSEASGLTAATAAQSGANTSDATTTGSSGPRSKKSGPPGDLALPPLPTDKLCNSYTGDVQAACLFTTMGTNKTASGAAQ